MLATSDSVVITGFILAAIHGFIAGRQKSCNIRTEGSRTMT